MCVCIKTLYTYDPIAGRMSTFGMFLCGSMNMNELEGWSMCEYMHVYTHVCIYIHVICMYVCEISMVCGYIYKCVCMCVCVYVSKRLTHLTPLREGCPRRLGYCWQPELVCV
jgi:hypothetical protein